MLKQMLIDYSKEVIKSEWGHCLKEKQACMRFLRDVKREGTDDFPYLFNEEKALNFLEWMSEFKHTKGKLAGQNIDPAPIQIFCYANLYGWEHKDTKLRRFKIFYWQVARKNAKTQSNACAASYEMAALGEPHAEIYIGATKKDQAKIMFDEMWLQIQASRFGKSFKKSYGKVLHKNGGFAESLSKDAGSTGDGFNPQAGFIDEYHAHKTAEIYEIIRSGQGARTQPLLSIITTAGFFLNNPCYAVEYQYVSRLLDPLDDVENEEYLAMVNELDAGDDIKDERNWLKANPILATYEEGLAYLRSELKIALDVPEKMRSFLTKNMNVWVDSPEGGYMDASKWDSCEADTDSVEEILLKGNCYIGVDLSMTTDLTSVGIIGVHDGKYAVKQMSFMPEEKYYERMNMDKVPYNVYVSDGKLRLTDGSVVDYTEVQELIERWCQQYNVMFVCFDKYNAAMLMNVLEQNGIPVMEIPQTFKFLSPATKAFREEVYKGTVLHDGDKLLKRAILNAVAKEDDAGNIQLTKSRSRGRIDPIAAVINAHARAMHDMFAVDLNSHFSSPDFSF